MSWTEVVRRLPEELTRFGGGQVVGLKPPGKQRRHSTWVQKPEKNHGGGSNVHKGKPTRRPGRRVPRVGHAS